MTRDMDLIRQLLLDLEAFPQERGGVSHFTAESFSIPGCDANQIDYHLSLIVEAGLIDGGGARPAEGIGFRRLTWAAPTFSIPSATRPCGRKRRPRRRERAGSASIFCSASPRRSSSRKSQS